MPVALRILLVLNAGALVAALLRADSPAGVAQTLIEIAVVLEPSALLAIAVLCVLRSAASARPRPLQWAIALAVPGLSCGAVCLVALPLLQAPTSFWASFAWVGGRVLLASAVALLLVEYFRLRDLALSPSLPAARLQALQARIRPHFLFNSLNTVLGLMRSDARRAERTLENLAELFRVFMRDTRDMVAIDEELATCRHYLEIEELRLGSRLVVHWDVDEAACNMLIPSLLLQPVVENAVRHGVEPSSEPGDVRIAVRLVGERIHVQVSNPWHAASPERPGNQISLSNIRERMSLLYDTGALLEAGGREGRFTVRLEFPARKERRRRVVQAPVDPDR
jgi:two-component system sensor histidine kinase AlgZ